jgi:2-keto-4-pentenoate hydratase/2-oxohepta-3-ene-1,7-dioic acid hydratase in catechol pathway
VKLARVDAGAGPRFARVVDDAFLPPPPGLAVFAPPLEAPLPRSEARLLAPVSPGKVVCIGRNYAAHAAELGHDVPPRPLVFLKAPSSVIGPGESIRLPPDSQRVEHEAELAIVIGRRCRHLRPEDALSAVFGFTCLNDVTARDLQRADKQFARGKGFDTFCPIGPWIETELDWRDLRVTCAVVRGGGSTLRQDGRTSLMMFDVPTLLATVSRVMTLEPGDVLATGTPAGVGPLEAGDVVEVAIEGIGRLSNPVHVDAEVPEIGPPIGA